SVSVALPQPDGHILIGGGFIQVDGHSRSYLARLNADGSYDPGFSAFSDGVVDAIVREPDGHLLVGGDFGSPHLKMARFDANGAVDSGFNLHIAGSRVSSIAMQADGSFLIGGSFQFVGSTPRKNLARFDRDFALDEGFAFDAEGGGFAPVASISLPANGIAVIGGELTSVNGDPRGHGARLRDDRLFAGGFD
ncbi:MAG TPA: delta-60 repeat domain-containing protein, partial [Rhodanobacteraceae bacterium]|nr:delta-60 repeat domain-containing protein [Rhodanobacteraceae bacterium]